MGKIYSKRTICIDMDKKTINKIGEAVRIAEGIGFGESPVWHPDGFIIFSDVSGNKIMKLKDQKLEIFLNESGWKGPFRTDHSDQPGANGLTFDDSGNMVFCQHGNHAISKMYPDGTIELIIDSYKGRRLNSPNDLCIGPDGSIYFTDPPYGIKGKALKPEIAQPLAGVYRWHKDSLELLSSEFNYPNGICFSPDYKYLYIGSNEPTEKRIRRYEINGNKLHNGITFLEENADGIKTDSEGNLYLATSKGVLVVSEDAEKIDFIDLPEPATNLCIHKQELYITTASGLYKCILS
jgi:gluconolactonase